MDDFYRIMTHRTEMVLGSAAMEALARAKVIVFGVGGVGSWCAEALVRSGLVNLTIVDSDTVCPTNINRQAQATSLNLGNVKVYEMEKKLLAINPGAAITAVHDVYDETSFSRFDLASCDYVIDAIDSLKNKVLLIEQCLVSGTKLYSSMGAASRTDPTRIKVGPLTGTVNCPLARVVRRNLRKKNLTTDITCVYSDELPVAPAVETLCGSGACDCCGEKAAGPDDASRTDWCSMKKQVNGSLVQITAIFGFTLASLVINDIRAKAAQELVKSGQSTTN